MEGNTRIHSQSNAWSTLKSYNSERTFRIKNGWSIACEIRSKYLVATAMLNKMVEGIGTHTCNQQDKSLTWELLTKKWVNKNKFKVSKILRVIRCNGFEIPAQNKIWHLPKKVKWTAKEKDAV